MFQHQIKMSHNCKVMRVIYSGPLSLEDTQDSITARIDHDGGQALKNIKVMVIDLTDARSTSTDIRTEVSFYSELAKINPNLILIGIAPGELEYGLCRQWQTYAEIEMLPLRNFLVRTKEEANRIIDKVLHGD